MKINLTCPKCGKKYTLDHRGLAYAEGFLECEGGNMECSKTPGLMRPDENTLRDAAIECAIDEIRGKNIERDPKQRVAFMDVRVRGTLLKWKNIWWDANSKQTAP